MAGEGVTQHVWMQVLADALHAMTTQAQLNGARGERAATLADEPLDFDSHIQVCAVNGFLVDNYDQAYEILTGEESPLPINLYNHAAVDFYGPKELVENDESLRRCNQRLADRRAAIRKKYQPD